MAAGRDPVPRGQVHSHELRLVSDSGSRDPVMNRLNLTYQTIPGRQTTDTPSATKAIPLVGERDSVVPYNQSTPDMESKDERNPGDVRSMGDLSCRDVMRTV